MAENLVLLVPGGRHPVRRGHVHVRHHAQRLRRRSGGAGPTRSATSASMATAIVPGIGPVGGADDVLALQAYLYACVDAEGDPSAIPEGPWDEWIRPPPRRDQHRAGRHAGPGGHVGAPIDAAGHRPGPDQLDPDPADHADSAQTAEVAAEVRLRCGSR